MCITYRKNRKQNGITAKWYYFSILLIGIKLQQHGKEVIFINNSIIIIQYLYFWFMKFEYDFQKSEANQLKHGIDFEKAQQLLWNDSDLVEISAKNIDEPRTIFIGKLRTNIGQQLAHFGDLRCVLFLSGGHAKTKPNFMKAEELDKKFDEGEDVLEHFDLSTIKLTNRAIKRVNVDFPSWMVKSLDKEATRIGVSRQSLIKLWLSERLELK